MTRESPGLFDGPAPRLRAVPASAPFLDLLAGAMVDALARAGDPFALSDALVLLPNRRATRGLIDAFAKRLGGAALLPSIRPLGDLDEDPQVWGADPIALDVAPAIEATRQRMELAALIRAKQKAATEIDDPARALALADELRALIDSAAAAERVHWDRLGSLVEEGQLAAHWQDSVKFLDIVSAYWPQRLAADGLTDPGARRSALLKALARDWTNAPPARPIVIAGSTGSIAATRDLMHVVARLPRGVVVFPGLDVDLDEEAWALVRDQHPQFALKETLQALGVARAEVPLMGGEDAPGRARRVLMREALAPAEKTADWLARLEAAGGAELVAGGAEGLRLIEAETEDEEAAVIALLIREAIQTEGRTAALVTPDGGLARRVDAKLLRWGLAPSVSHGAPLRESEAGVLIGLLCELARDEAEPVALASLLKHPRQSLTSDAPALASLEHEAWCGPRRFDTLADLERLDKLEKRGRARAIVSAVAAALQPIRDVMAAPTVTLGAFADAVAQAAETIAPDAWRGRDGEAVATLLRDAIAHGEELAPMAAHFAPRVLMRLMEGAEAPPAPGGDPRVAIWGPLEARLQRRDLMILGGLNEGAWPAAPPEDPFLSRSMRDRLGLPSVDQRIGLAAHDFAQLANAPEVALTRSLRKDGAPTVASRWLWRLKTLAQGARATLDRGEQYLRWARAMDAPAEVRPVAAPAPKPPAGKRLTRISVTQVETLIRDPYAVYARRILGLEVRRPIGAPAGAAERGAAVHKAIERFRDGDDPQALIELLDEELKRAGISPERRVSERARLAVSAAALVRWLAQRNVPGMSVHLEAPGKLDVDGVLLSCIADRIELSPSRVAILDFKTGQPPNRKQVESGLSPQLPLEAAMLARGAFEGLPSARTDELLYWRFGNSDPTPQPLAIDAHAEGEKALVSLRGLLGDYAAADQPFLSKPRVLFIRPFADYDHLARRQEWAEAEGET